MKKLLLGLLLLGSMAFGQNSDSLLAVFENSKGDSLITRNYFRFVVKSFDKNPDTVKYYYEVAKDRVSQNPIAQAKLLVMYGNALMAAKAQYLGSKTFEDALRIYREEGDREEELKVIKRLSSLYKRMDKMDLAQTVCFEGLKVSEEIGDHENAAMFLRTIGVNYTKMQSFQNAKKHLEKAIETSIKHKDTVGITYGYMSLGNVFKAEEKFDEAESQYLISLELAELKGDKRAIAGNYNNMASNLKLQKKYNEAIAYYEKAIEINKESGNRSWLSYNYNNIGNVYSKLGKYELSLKYQLKSFELKKEMDDVEGLETSYYNIAEIYKDLGNYKEATHFYDLYIKHRQNSLIEQNLLNLNELSAKYEDEKKEERLAHLDTLRYMDSLTIVASNESIAKGKSLQKTMWGGLFLLIGFVAYLTYSIRQKKKVNSALKDARNSLSQKNKDLTDSISYAKHIQENILTSTNVLRNAFDDSLIVYKPKDIVSGDFYWFKSFEHNFVFALADCTGHGVPGAFMSLICISAINSVTSNASTTSPGIALKQIDNIVNETLNGSADKNGTALADGMDIALCSIDKRTGVLQYAGAYRPVVIVRGGEVMRVRADKMSIGGGVFQDKNFKDHTIQLEKNDVIYLFSDGYPDQFGGERGKKLKVGPFMKLLASISDKPLSDQEKLLESHLKEWMNDLEQVDDISVIALRYS